MIVLGVQTIGFDFDQNSLEWVSSYRLKTSTDCTTFDFVLDDKAVIKVNIYILIVLKDNQMNTLLVKRNGSFTFHFLLLDFSFSN